MSSVTLFEIQNKKIKKKKIQLIFCKFCINLYRQVCMLKLMKENNFYIIELYLT